jgi:hypothetical protein
MNSTKIVSIALAGGLLGALLSIAPVDANPVNGWGGVRGSPQYGWHPNLYAGHANPYAWRRNHGSINFWSPYSDYWPHSDYWPPYAGWDCVGSIQWKNAFCY